MYSDKFLLLYFQRIKSQKCSLLKKNSCFCWPFLIHSIFLFLRMRTIDVYSQKDDDMTIHTRMANQLLDEWMCGSEDEQNASLHGDGNAAREILEIL